MHNSNRPEETLMAAHMEVLAVTGEKMRRRIHEGRATLSGSKCHERCLLSENEGFSFSSLGCMLEVGLERPREAHLCISSLITSYFGIRYIFVL